MNLTELNESVKAKKARRRIGRGNGSGWGKTAGRGHKGAKSRSGWKRKDHFEGGQLPAIRRFPKRGFSNALWKKDLSIVNLSALNVFDDGAVVTPEELLKRRIILKLGDGLKVLGHGELTKKLEVHAHKFSAKARASILEKGGSVKDLETKRASALKAIKSKRFQGKTRRRQLKAGKVVTRRKA
jgi:large subunit ribosomal protein L15